MRIAVTGASGKLGTVVVRELRASGHEVVGMDVVGARGAGFVQVDFTDYGQTVDALQAVNDQHDGLDAVVHLAAIPAPGIRSAVATFHNNIAVTFNVMWAAIRLGITRIVTASSETVQGLPFDVPPPYIPVDEAYAARPESVYSLVKHLEETMEKELVRWHPEVSVTALRFSNVMIPADYAEFPSFDADATQRKWNLWSYIDARDGAAVIARALEVAPAGFDHFLIAAGDTVMSRPNAELVADVFPDVEIRGELGVNDSLFSTAKAQRLLGWSPQHSWRDEV
ncbi:MAG: UDP-glucose 4-epimerase [Microbacterium sp. 69-7]|uniref:NAD-dependent epimerase/dehydratase family protein n=1 Tax=Microbacterium sp. 69-7 TaxID=1895784 RepID=UPI00095D1646|nr:NAD(P)-dependent oxidoreductase [Microbacterium sp. 69-7]OJU44585.1 MAG: UDP-glucose 4-epimerase [Microbacterium sp. 69-7]